MTSEQCYCALAVDVAIPPTTYGSPRVDGRQQALGLDSAIYTNNDWSLIEAMGLHGNRVEARVEYAVASREMWLRDNGLLAPYSLASQLAPDLDLISDSHADEISSRFQIQHAS